METTYIIIAVVIIGVILLIFVVGSLVSHLGKPSTSKTTTVSSGAAPQTPATTSTPAVVDYTNINVQYVYTGNNRYNNINCTYDSYTYIDGTSGTVNGSQIFYYTFQPSSSQCPMTIANISVATPGFSVINVNPILPYSMPSGSQAKMQIELRAPNFNFYGPLTITITYH